MSIDYTRGDSPAYDGYRESWASQREAELQARIDELEAELVQRGEMKTAYDENGVPYLVEAEGSEAEHIIDLLKAEQDGRLLVLPCKVGDTMFVRDRDGIPREMRLDQPDIRFTCTDEENLCNALCPRKPNGFCAYRVPNDGSAIGTVILTLEEAEAALKEEAE